MTIMSGKPLIHRVGLAHSLSSDNNYEFVLGVFDYCEHINHWQFVTAGDRFFLREGELDPARIDGVIGSYATTQSIEPLIKAGVAVVNLSNALADLQLPRVGNDDLAIGRMGAAHLLERGFAQFGYLGEHGYWFSRQRGEGFRDIIERQARRECHWYECGGEGAKPMRVEIRDWLSQLPKPIAVMTSNDHLAGIAVTVAEELGLRVPDDVAVLGVDNYRWVILMTRTPISSVAPDGRLIGYRAAKLLDDLMAGQPAPPPQWIRPLGVVTRRSTDIMLADDTVVSEALRYIREHCLEGITVEDVLDVVRISRRSLEYRMKRSVGYTPQVAITRAQIERAKKLLIESDLTMGQVSRTCGFRSQNSFCVTFKHHTGLPPGQYRQQHTAPLRNNPWARRTPDDERP
ncbi:MAG: helix-turn-helix domain-containing protein [Phycisphaera sp.]|nr:helix-turn-helix domain-containing protein [Phycisphaera sp.]